MGDFYKDDKPDLAVINQNIPAGSSLTILRNTSNVSNAAPTAVTLTPSSASLSEDTSTTSALELSTISITDDGQGTNTLSLSGPDAASFEIVGNKLRLKAGTVLNFHTKPSYSMRVNVDDTTLGTTPDAFADFTLTITGLMFAPAVNFGGGASRFDVAIADINGDKNPDLVTANHVSQHVSVLLGDGTGLWNTSKLFSGYHSNRGGGGRFRW